MSRVIEVKVKQLPCDTPIPIDYPEVPAFTRGDYEDRIKKLLALGDRDGYTHLIVYADREHYANLHYLTGFDARFEEALLIVKKDERPKLVVGNEGYGYAEVTPVAVDKELYQLFGLMGQPNESSKTLLDIFRESGVCEKSRVGFIGWKYYPESFFSTGKSILDVPNYMVETLCLLTGRGNIHNATDLLAHNEYGLKHAISAKEAVYFEIAGTKASRRVYNVIKNLRPGMTEIEASEYLQIDGDPVATHPNINFGDHNVSLGLGSPTYHKKLQHGDIVGAGMGYRGSLVHKVGLFIKNRDELRGEYKDCMERFYKPYFASVASWYEAIRIGNTYGAVYDIVDTQLDIKRFNIGLNPGHFVHTDEWTNSPFSKGNEIRIRSGVAIQCDYTATFYNPYLSAHIEDGLVVADAELREEIRKISPSCYERIQIRRRFFKETLHIKLADEVLPLSDLGGICFPYMADPTTILCME
jgi:hypothetical protein